MFLHADSADSESDCADAQADLSLRWAHMPYCWFCREAAHTLYNGIAERKLQRYSLEIHSYLYIRIRNQFICVMYNGRNVHMDVFVF